MSVTNDPTIPDDEFRDDALLREQLSSVPPTLVVAFCPSEPWRIGESAILPAADAKQRALFGRGSAQPDDAGQRLSFARYTGASIETALPIGAPGLSRQQALLSVSEDGWIEIENIGKCPLLINGVPEKLARVVPGDVIQFGKQFLLLCLERSSRAPVEGYPQHEYGCADDFGIVGESAVITRLRRSIAFLATRSEHVLIHGASGTGKELVSRAIHALSPRGAFQMVSRNAATLPEGLIDAELFGNVKNYPHAGMTSRPGLVGEAHRSTLFLDEFAELPPAMQVHLLRVLDSGEYQPLGEATLRKSDFRLIAATNRPISVIKEDLLARLSLRLLVPDLNQRRDDIPWLVRHILLRFASSDRKLSARLFPNGHERGEPALGIEFVQRLLRHEFRTNVRELEVILWASIEQADSAPLSWPDGLKGTEAGPSSEPQPAEAELPERQRLQAVLDRHNGRIESAWRELGLRNRYALRRLIAKYKLELRRRSP